MSARLRRWGSVCAVAAATVALSVQVPAAADPAGTVVLTSASSAFPAFLNVRSATANWVFYSADGGLYARPVGGGAATLVSDTAFFTSAFGDVVWYDDGSGVLQWTNLATSATGTLPADWQTQSPDGRVYLVSDDLGKVHIYDQPMGGSAADLGILPAAATVGDQILAGPNGAAVVSVDGSGNTVVSYATYSSPSITALAGLTAYTGDQFGCSAISSTGVVCADYTTQTVVRLPLDGGALVATPAGGDISSVAATASTTFWVGDEAAGSRLHSVPAAGGTVSQVSADVYQVAANDSTAYFDMGTTVATSGIYSAAAASDTPALYLLAGAATLSPTGVGLTPGRAVWRDDSATNMPVWSRSLSSSGGTITAGSTVKLAATGASTYGNTAPSVSATRTLYGTVPSTGNGLGIVLNVGGKNTTLPGRGFVAPQLSGTRIVYQGIAHPADSFFGHSFLYNLVTKTTTDLTSSLGAKRYSTIGLFGDYVAYAKPDGSIWRKRLGASTATKLQGAVATGNRLDNARVFVAGDWVAWERFIEHNGNITESIGLRNARKMSAIVSLSNLNSLEGITEGGVIVYNQTPDRFQLRTWGGAIRNLPQTLAVPTIDGSVVGWVGADGHPRVAPLGTHLADPPRSLGNASAGKSLTLGKTWRLDLVTSAALPHCSVKIENSAGNTVRTLSCAGAAAKQGEIQVSWNGKNASGHNVHAGTFTWVVVASNGDGSLLNADGSTKATSGTITVSS